MSAAGPLWRPAYVGLGSNMGDSRRHVLTAFGDIDGLDGVRLIARSALYRSRPLGPVDQPDYINAVAGLLTRLEPAALLAALRSIEALHGRDRSAGQRWGPRTLDLDLLLFADAVVDTPGLVLPHPGIAERNFVLLPLAAIAPELAVPGLGRVAVLARRVGDDGIECIENGKDDP